MCGMNGPDDLGRFDVDLEPPPCLESNIRVMIFLYKFDYLIRFIFRISDIGN